MLTSRMALDNMTPVTPPKVNMKMNPITQHSVGCCCMFLSDFVKSQVNTLIPVGIAITIVAAV